LKTVEDMRGSLTRTMMALEPFIQPLVLQARLSNREGGWK
jgi:3-deoxy-D-manno-octulosonic-acid transferase